MELSAGTLICGRFELLREESPNTGVPVFGPTWAVLDTDTGEPARACLLDASLLPGVEQRRAFIRAIEEVADLHDASLVPQVFVGEEGEHAVVCFDPLQGAFSLGDLYEGTESAALPGEAGRLARQLAQALALLHARGRVHGMLSCEAVFVGPQGPAVFQYAFAPLCARAELERRCRAFHLGNLAIELRGGGGKFSPASDIYAWGVTLAQFVTGQRGEAATRAKEPTGLPSGLWALIHECLADAPAARPRDGAELLRRLDGSPPPVVAADVQVDLLASGELVLPSASGEMVVPPSPPPPRKQGSNKAGAEERMRPGVPGKALPVVSFEEMLLVSDRTSRPTTIPPGMLAALAVSSSGSHATLEAEGKGSTRSSSGLRRVHVLTEDAIVRTGKPSTSPSVEPSAASEVIVGGSKADMEISSKNPTVKLEPVGLGAAAPTREPSAKAKAPRSAQAPQSSKAPAPVTPADTTFWWVLAGLISAVIVALFLL